MQKSRVDRAGFKMLASVQEKSQSTQAISSG